jgi:hypothetical protein
MIISPLTTICPVRINLSACMAFGCYRKSRKTNRVWSTPWVYIQLVIAANARSRRLRDYTKEVA